MLEEILQDPLNLGNDFNHDHAVREDALALDSMGCEVRADHVPSYSDPDPIGGHVPDIGARCGTGNLIVEHDSEITSQSEGQLKEFRKAAESDPNTQFYHETPEKDFDPIVDLDIFDF